MGSQAQTVRTLCAARNAVCRCTQPRRSCRPFCLVDRSLSHSLTLFPPAARLTMAPKRVGIVGYGKLGQYLAKGVLERPAELELAFVWNRCAEEERRRGTASRGGLAA